MTLKPLFFLLGAIFVVSLAFSFAAHISPHADAKAYNHISWNLARGLGYLENEKLAATPEKDDAIIRVGPGYEFFLAGIYTFFQNSAERIYGEDVYKYEPAWRAVWIVHALLRALTAFFLFKIALLLFPHHPKKEWIGLTTAALFGFFPDLILINAFLLYETLLLFLGVAAVYFSLKALSRPNIQCFQSTSNVGSASLFWALAILTRPSELLPFLIFPIALFLAKQKMRFVALSFLFPVLLVGGWSLRNSLLYDQPLFTTTAGAYALWVGNNEYATGGYDRPPELREARSQYHSTELSRISIQNVKKFVVEQPSAFFKLQFKKTVQYVSLIRPTGFWLEFENAPGKRFIIVISSALATAFLFIAGAAGIFKAWKQKNSLLLTFFGFLLAKPFAVIPFYVETRYRYSLYPLVAIMAAFFVINLVTSSQRATFIQILAGAFAAFLVIASIDAWFSLPIILNRLPILLGVL